MQGVHQRIGLREGGVLDVQAIHGNAVECGVVQHHYAVRVERQPLLGWGFRVGV